MRVGSLFSGIGGFELGLQMASSEFEIAWQVEQDEFCQKVLAKHWPDTKRWDDVKTFPPDPVEDWAVDLICGGWPCQPVSAAGLQKGESDERWLWPEFLRICEVLRPRWVLGENVTGLMSAPDAMGRRGGLFGGVLRDLASLGYRVEYHCIPAASIGALHRRDRVWLIGKLADPVSQRGRSRDDQRQDAVHADARREAIGIPVDCGRWSVECRLDRSADGVSCGVDCRGWECGVPRVATGQRDRIARLKALGNSVVPQVVQFIARQIMEADVVQGGDGYYL